MRDVCPQPFSEDSDPSQIGHSIIDLLDDKTQISAPVVRQSWLDNGPGTSPDKRGSDKFRASKLGGCRETRCD